MTDFHTSLDAALARLTPPHGDHHMLAFTVTGLPAPQGSKRGFYNKNLGRVQMVESSKKVAPWRQDVTAAALDAIAQQEWQQPTGPVTVTIGFYLPRPGYHFRSGKHANELKPDAPTYVDKKPDLDKLIRSTLDALTSSGAVKDDAQVAGLTVTKRYAAPGAPTGADISVRPLTAVAAATTPPGETAATVQGALL